MLGHPQHHAVAGCNLDRVADRAVLHQRIGEGRTHHRRRGRDADRHRLVERAEHLHRQTGLLGGGSQFGGILVNLVHQLAAEVVEGAVRGFLGDFRSQLRAHLLERRGLAFLDLAQVDHVVAEVGLDRAADLAGLHREQRILERLDHHALLDPAEVAAAGLGAGIVGIGLGQRGEIRTRLARLVGQPGGLGLGGLAGGLVGLGIHLDQDVRSQALLGLDEPGLVRVVALAQRVLARRCRRRQLRCIQIDVFDGHALRPAERLAVAVVPLLDLRIGDRRGVGRRFRQLGDLHVAGLADQPDQTVHLVLADERRLADAGRDHLHAQAVAHQLLELLRRALRRLRHQHHAVAVAVELAVDLERRDRGDVVAHGGVADHDAGLVRGQLHDLLVDQLVQHLELVFPRLERARIEAVALGLALLLAGLLEPGAEFLGADVHVLPQQRGRPPRRRRTPPCRRRLHAHQAAGVAAAEVVGHADEGERDDQQTEDDGGDPSRRLVTKSLQHLAGNLADVEPHSLACLPGRRLHAAAVAAQADGAAPRLPPPAKKGTAGRTPGCTGNPPAAEQARRAGFAFGLDLGTHPRRRRGNRKTGSTESPSSGTPIERRAGTPGTHSRCPARKRKTPDESGVHVDGGVRGIRTLDRAFDPILP